MAPVTLARWFISLHENVAEDITPRTLPIGF